MRRTEIQRGLANPGERGNGGQGRRPTASGDKASGLIDLTQRLRQWWGPPVAYSNGR